LALSDVGGYREVAELAPVHMTVGARDAWRTVRLYRISRG
jgi:hypothetical protein